MTDENKIHVMNQLIEGYEMIEEIKAEILRLRRDANALEEQLDVEKHNVNMILEETVVNSIHGADLPGKQDVPMVKPYAGETRTLDAPVETTIHGMSLKIPVVPVANTFVVREIPTYAPKVLTVGASVAPVEGDKVI